MMLDSQRIRMLLMLTALVLCTSVSGYALATLFAPPSETIQEPVIKGTFAMNLEVANVNDLYAWQVAIVYEPSQLKVLEMTPGGFVGDDYPFFVNSTDSFEDLLLFGGTLYGKVGGKNGDGKLATIVFGYFAENYDEPKIALNGFETFLLDSHGQLIPFKNITLTLTTAEQP